jgi:hypothetical protein
MKKYYFLLIAVCSLVFISCGTDSRDADAATTTAPVTNVPAGTTQPVTTQQNPAAPASTVAPPSTVAPGQLTQSASATGVVLNPAHGQPGHDCAIPVGQPLKSQSGTVSAPIQITTQPTQTTQAPSTVTPLSQPTTAKPKLNPAHGQPWHDCSIGVGQPLKN